MEAAQSQCKYAKLGLLKQKMCATLPPLQILYFYARHTQILTTITHGINHFNSR